MVAYVSVYNLPWKANITKLVYSIPVGWRESSPGPISHCFIYTKAFSKHYEQGQYSLYTAAKKTKW